MSQTYCADISHTNAVNTLKIPIDFTSFVFPVAF